MYSTIRRQSNYDETPRTLMGIIRLSMALAKLRLGNIRNYFFLRLLFYI